METSTYDSRADTLAHVKRVNELLLKCSIELQKRGIIHDDSKLIEPEKSTFDACTLKLKAMAYGSDEYKAALTELKPALDHHYAANSHHPEHFAKRESGPMGVMLRGTADAQEEQANAAPFGERAAAQMLIDHAKFLRATADQLEAEVNSMNLFDVLEMLMDWKAATERMANGGDIRRSLEINRDRFKMSPQLESIFANTIRDMGW